MVTFKQYIGLNEVASATPQSSTYGGGKITETHGGVRNLPLSPALRAAITNALNGTALDWHSHSGGQPASGGNRVGSHRHDNGNGSDGDFVESGTSRVLNADAPADRQKIAAALGKLKAAGIKGFGWDSSTTGKGHYMGSTRFHLDVAGPAGVWGSSMRSNTAAPWVLSAIGGAPQGEVEGDFGDETNAPPGAEENGAPADYENVASAAGALAQGFTQALGGGMYQ